MKKRLLTLLGGALLGLFSMNVTAQNWVDVTDTYLKNAGFDVASDMQAVNLTVSPAANKDVTSWTYAGSNSWAASGCIAYGTAGKINGASLPSTDSNEVATGGALAITGAWDDGSGFASYTQAVTLPAGKYKMEFVVNNVGQNNNFRTSYFGFKTSAKNYYGTITSFPVNTWTTESVEFSLSEETTGNASVGFGWTHTGSGNTPKLVIDCVKLYFDNTVDKTSLAALITTAEGLYSVSGNEAAAFKTAIDAAKAVNTKATATIAEVLGAETALQAAIDAYKLANASESNPVDFTTQIGDIASSTAGWTFTTGAQNKVYKTSEEKNTTAYTAAGFIENWNGSAFTGEISYTITGLPAGTYRISAYAFDSTKSGNVYFFAGNKEVALDNSTDLFTNPVITGVSVAENANLKVGLNVKNSASNWVGIANIKVEYIGAYNPCVALLDELQSLVDEADALIKGGANVGSKAFQIPTSAKSVLETAYQEADDVVNSSDDADEIQESIEAITEAIETYKSPTLNAPSSGKRYSVKLVYEGWSQNNKAMTYIAGGRSDMGGYNIQYEAAPASYYAQAFKFTPATVEGKKNCYTLSQIDNDDVERYICTGVPYSGNTSQIRTTTDATKALVVEVRATSTEGKWNLWNTEANQFIGSQDAGVFTVNSHIDFALAEAPKAEATLSVTDVHWGTFIAPFDVTIPEGVEAYTCTGVEGTSITMEEVETKIPANTPVLVYSDSEKTENFSDYGHATKNTYEAGIMVGTYEDVQPAVGCYLLQKNDDNTVTFNQIVSGGATPWVRANRCYLSVSSSSTVLRFGDATGIQSVEQQSDAVIYDLTGRRVDAAVKGIYIVNGKKMLVK